MMLQINHRESHDIDLFLDDPQLLPYVTASVGELEFQIGAPSYNSDGVGHLKIAFEGVGEIDFIVTGHILDPYAKAIEILGREVDLETVPEIITKKIRFRGASIQPRDIFDIAAASNAGYGQQLRDALAEIAEYRDTAARRLDALNEDYVNATIQQLMLKPNFEATARHAIAIARSLLRS
ncbi:nucleotidyl transferase AbiEii/AbiGii toxin family protein [Flavimaribacter sediminis]